MLFELTGTDGSDSLVGAAGADVLNGGKANDTLRGAAGDDQLNGGEGDDLLVGGTGADRMDGGSGRDTFQIGSGDSLKSGHDSIVGIETGASGDTLDLPGAFAIAADTTGPLDGSDAGGISSHSLSSGLVSFFDADGEVLAPGTLDSMDAVAYLDANLADGEVAAFLAGNDAYVFLQSGGQDTLVQLFASSTLEGLTLDPASPHPNHLFIA